MMYGIVRIIITLLFLGCAVILVKKYKAPKKRSVYILLAVAAVLFDFALGMLPFENLFLTFDSPKAAYQYYHGRQSDIALIVEGNDCDLIVACQNNTKQLSVVPKTDSGWKIGVGMNYRMIAQKMVDGIVVQIDQYKNTNDYFISVFHVNGAELEISDSCNTEFQILRNHNEYLKKSYISYYGHLEEFNSQYSITVNGCKIVLEP